MPAELPASVDRALRLARVDFAPVHRQPSALRLLAATLVSLAGSLFADALLVRFGEALFPSTWYYPHFRLSDYGKLTVIGVIIACLAWPIVTRVSSAPRWLFFRLAIAVTLVLLLPDAYILVKGQNPQAVAVLVAMHLAIALITYNCLVHIAKVRAVPAGHQHAEGDPHAHGGDYPQDGRDPAWDSAERRYPGQPAGDRYQGGQAAGGHHYAGQPAVDHHYAGQPAVDHHYAGQHAGDRYTDDRYADDRYQAGHDDDGRYQAGHDDDGRYRLGPRTDHRYGTGQHADDRYPPAQDADDSFYDRYYRQRDDDDRRFAGWDA